MLKKKEERGLASWPLKPGYQYFNILYRKAAQLSTDCAVSSILALKENLPFYLLEY